jgi:hypothetical protein
VYEQNDVFTRYPHLKPLARSCFGQATVSPERLNLSHKHVQEREVMLEATVSSDGWCFNIACNM